MAAYAALVSLMNDLELMQNHPRHSFSFDNKQIASLSQTVHFLIDFMESYDSHGCRREAVEVLESRIASAAHAAHDVVEIHLVDQIHAGTTLDGKARSYFLLDLQKAIENMGFVKRKAMQFEAKYGTKAEHTTYSPPISSQPLSSGKNCMVGFDAVLLQLMEMLTGEDSSRLVIPIVGMGGMGKTTLARNAYDHLLIQQHFDVRCWATISQQYSAKSILMELLFGERNSTGGNVNELGVQLHQKLSSRRYLIILDDVWSVDAWDEIQMYLPDNDNGSRVVVTTRLSNLATNLSSSPFKMNFLDEDESWKLFCGNVFEEEEEYSVELEGIGRRIVRRCGGLPLSIVVIGGHLRKSSRAVEYWEKVSSSMNPIWSLDEDEKCMNIISLSYHQLPVCLTPCFLYFGVFEEDESIYIRKLLRLWVAEGFVKPKEGLSLEEVAEGCLEDLIDRNLVIVRGDRRWNGKAEYCVLHDIVREFCLKEGKKEKFVWVLDSTQALLGERRIATPSEKLNSDIDNALESAPLLRSLIQLDWFEGDQETLSAELRLLRVSHCVQANICPPEADIQRVNLRYFASIYVIVSEIRSLPWSISLCWNLQTINIKGNIVVEISAPQEIWEMAQLRHLEFYQLFLPDPLPGDQQECIILRNLQTLVRVTDFKLTEEVCERMPNIKELSLLYDVKASSDCYPFNLGRFNKLESVRLFGCDSVQSFTFPSSLQELRLECHESTVDWEDFGMIIKSLPHLGFLSLDSVKGQEWSLAVEEEFPSLKYLSIGYCDDLIYWNANSSNFPVLEILDIEWLPKLSDIPFDMGDIPTLARIYVRLCSVSAAVSAMRIAVEQHINCGNEDLQLEVRFEKMEEVERFQKLVQENDLKTNSLRLSCGGRIF